MTSTSREPVPAGRAPSTTLRWVLRVVGAVLLLVGLFLLVRGGLGFVDEMRSTPTFEDNDAGVGSILSFAGGGFLVVFGLGALSAGFLGAQARYASGEIAPAVREVGSAFRGEARGGAAEGSGRFCSSCGARARREARFCDACGHELVPG